MYKRSIVFLFIMSFMYGDIDFDSLEKESTKHHSVSMQVHDGDVANKKAFKSITNKQKKAVNKFLSSISSAHSQNIATSGSHTYQCSYHCRTDGLSSNDTDTIRINIKADTRYEAEDKLGKISKKHCRSLYAEGTFGKKWMWSTSERCE